MKTLSLVLRPVTPIHVWSGKKLLMGLDIVRRGADTLCVVDLNMIPPSIVNELASARAEDMPRILEKYSAQLPCKLVVKAVEAIPLNVQVLELNQYIVPGSTLKGYIRTAILFHMLKGIGDKAKLVEVLESGIDLTQEPKRVSEGLEARFFRAPKPPKQGGFVDSFQSLLVSDPELRVDADCLRVSELQVAELSGGKLKPIARQFAVVATCGELRYRVSIRVPTPEILNSIVQRVHEHVADVEKLRLLDGVDIAKVLKEFGCFILSKEIERVSIYKELGDYLNLLKNLYTRYCEKESRCVIARLGYMTGHIAKTVLSIVKDVHPQLYQQIRAYMESKLHHTWDELTIKLVRSSQGLVGPGWCEVCIE
jgi:CRISPR-associated protein Csm5